MWTAFARIYVSNQEELPALMTVFEPVVVNRKLFQGKGTEPGLLRRRERLLEIGAAIDRPAEAFARSASSPLQAPELPALLQGSPRLVPRIRDGQRLTGGRPPMAAVPAAGLPCRPPGCAALGTRA